MFNAIVVGIDGSPYGHSALEAAIGIAKAFGSTLHLVAADNPMLGEDVQRAIAALPREFRGDFDPHSEVHRHLDDALFEARQAGVTAEPYEVRAHPADALLDTADDAGPNRRQARQRRRGRKPHRHGQCPDSSSRCVPISYQSRRITRSPRRRLGYTPRHGDTRTYVPTR